MTQDEIDAQRQRKHKARAILSGSDWVVARALETSVMGPEWCTWRDEVRKIANTGEGEIPPEPARRPNVHAEKPEPIEIPRFLAPDPLEDVPESLQDLAEPDETPEAMQARMWSLWLELNGKLMLGLATTEETALHSRLHNELHWFAPPIEGET